MAYSRGCRDRWSRVFAISLTWGARPIVDAMRPRAGRPRLLQQLRLALRVHHYSPRTEEAYVGWVRRYVRFHGLRHPEELGHDAIGQFLSALADRAKLSASSQTQALSALIFLYREVLGEDLGAVVGLIRAKQPGRLPVVLGRFVPRLRQRASRSGSRVTACVIRSRRICYRMATTFARFRNCWDTGTSLRR